MSSIEIITCHHFEERQYGSERVWINQPKNGLDKQCKLQECLRAESPNWGSFFGWENTSQHQQKDSLEQGCILSIFSMLGQIKLYQFSGYKVFLSTAGYFRNKNVLKHEAEILEKIRTF